jgi:quinol monooxygenase YgiN
LRNFASINQIHQNMSIQRIVRMTFQPEKLAAFMQVFNQSKFFIRSFPGCEQLHFWQEIAQPNVCYTYSRWASLEALEQYRQSELFKTTWAATKVCFAAKPEAWSVQVLEEVQPEL